MSASVKNARLWMVGSLLVLVGLVGVSLLVGSRTTPVGASIAAVPAAVRYALSSWGEQLVGDTSQQAQLAVLIGGLRVPRTVLAPLAGACLGAAGAVIQGHTRNPLADPSVLGINAGAAVAVVGVAVLMGAPSPLVVTVTAMIGALIVTALVFALSSAGGLGSSPLTLVLAGMALSALLMAVVHATVISNINALDTFRSWATGSVAGSSMATVAVVSPLAVVGLVAAALQSRTLDVLSLGVEAAHGLGVDVARQRVIAVLVVAVLGGCAVAGAGALPFVGLAAPHIVRGLVGHSYVTVVPASMVCGAVCALSADIIGRVVVQPSELAMGIVLAVGGAPLFIALVRRNRAGVL